MAVRLTAFISLPGLMLLAIGCGTQTGSEPAAPTDSSPVTVSSDSQSPDAEEGTSQKPAKTGSRLEIEPVYSVAEYNAERDPQKDLQATIAQASRDGKRIILEVGGNW